MRGDVHGTSHKQGRRLTPRLRKRAVSGWKRSNTVIYPACGLLENTRAHYQIQEIITLSMTFNLIERLRRSRPPRMFALAYGLVFFNIELLALCNEFARPSHSTRACAGVLPVSPWERQPCSSFFAASRSRGRGVKKAETSVLRGNLPTKRFLTR